MHAIPLMKRLFRTVLKAKARGARHATEPQGEMDGDCETTANTRSVSPDRLLRIMDLLMQCRSCAWASPSASGGASESQGESENGNATAENSASFLDMLLLIQVQPPSPLQGSQGFLRAIGKMWQQSLHSSSEPWLIIELHSWTIRHLRQWSDAR